MWTEELHRRLPSDSIFISTPAHTHMHAYTCAHICLGALCLLKLPASRVLVEGPLSIWTHLSLPRQETTSLLEEEPMCDGLPRMEIR